METIKKVYVIHKTHLDIGFTDLAKEVLNKYVTEFIPQAINTAYECNKNGEKVFVWTVGSYIIQYFLEHAEEEACAKLEKAIRDGYIVWHGLSYTTHTELMDSDLFEYSISIAEKLNEKFNKTSIAAKMTDVPCHTCAIIPYLEKHGIKYLHIGINESSKAVKIPEFVLWKYGESEIILNYAGDYGKTAIWGDIALEFAHTADNMGPPTVEIVKEEMERIKSKYPGAEVASSSLDDFARALLKYKDKLPVIDSEMGDTWIHGVATDPFKTGLFLELLRLRKEWLKQSNIDKEKYETFMENMLLVCEHTWGMDIKKYLYDFKNWEKADFIKARLSDKTNLAELEPAGTKIVEFIKTQLADYTQNQFKGGYSIFEKSWEEQRHYVFNALECLPQELKSQAQDILKKLSPKEAQESRDTTDERRFDVEGRRVEVLEDGSIKIGHLTLGILSYDVFSAQTVNDCYLNYNRNLDTVGVWAEPDFSKPNLASASDLEDESFAFSIDKVVKEEDTICVYLQGNAKAIDKYGSPRKARIVYKFTEDKIAVNLTWYAKDANRMPEAIYFGFIDEEATTTMIQKLGMPINPYDVTEGANRKLHSVEKLHYGDMEISSLHAPLLSVGGKNIYDTHDNYLDAKKGMYYVLYNNRWGTNFRLWYEENAGFEFEICQLK